MYTNQTSISHVDMVTDNSPSSARYGSAMANGNEVHLQFAWDVVKGKLVDSLSTIRNGVDFSERVAEIEQNPAKQPSNLCAIAEGPRIRLLWASFQWLHKEVTSISTESATNSKKDFLAVFTEILHKCCQPLCTAWLEEELSLVPVKPDKKIRGTSKRGQVEERNTRRQHLAHAGVTTWTTLRGTGRHVGPVRQSRMHQARGNNWSTLDEAGLKAKSGQENDNFTEKMLPPVDLSKCRPSDRSTP